MFVPDPDPAGQAVRVGRNGVESELQHPAGGGDRRGERLADGEEPGQQFPLPDQLRRAGARGVERTRRHDQHGRAPQAGAGKQPAVEERVPERVGNLEDRSAGHQRIEERLADIDLLGLEAGAVGELQGSCIAGGVAETGGQQRIVLRRPRLCPEHEGDLVLGHALRHEEFAHRALELEQHGTFHDDGPVFPLASEVLLPDARAGVDRAPGVGVRLAHVVERDLAVVAHEVVGIGEEAGDEAAAPVGLVRLVGDVDLDLDPVVEPALAELVGFRLQHGGPGHRRAETARAPRRATRPGRASRAAACGEACRGSCRMSIQVRPWRAS